MFHINLIVNIANIILLLIIFIIIYNLLQMFKEKDLDKKLSNRFDSAFNETYENSIEKIRYLKYFASHNKKPKYLQKLNMDIEKSNIRKYFKYFSVGFLVLISVGLSIIGFIISYALMFNIFAAVIIAIFMYQIPHYIVQYIDYKNASQIDNRLVNVTNILLNFCYVQDDIYYAIENSIPYIEDPLKSFFSVFVSEVRHGIPPFDALEELKSKVENKRFKLLMKNLQLCTKHNGSYIEVLNNAKNILEKYDMEKLKRKKLVQKHRTNIYAMMIVCIVIVYGVIQINPYLPILLKKDLAGELISAFCIFTQIYAFYKSLTLQKFEY